MLRRVSVSTLLVTLALFGVLEAQTPIKRTPLQKFDVPGTAYETVIGIAEIAANVNVGRHTHPGPTVFVLLEGELEETLADGRTRTLRAGQGFWNRARGAHNVRNVGSLPARALAVHLDPAG